MKLEVCTGFMSKKFAIFYVDPIRTVFTRYGLVAKLVLADYNS